MSKDKTSNQEIEVRFLDIDTKEIIRRLVSLQAQDLGEDFLREIIFYDKELKWRTEKRFIRLRQTKKGIFVSYKHKPQRHSIHTTEIEIKVNDWNNAKFLFEAIGLIAFREQEKKRHTFQLGDVTVDLDTWPSLPTYIELEGPSEEALKNAAQKLQLDWGKAVFAGAGYVIEHYYHIPVTTLKHFTFDKIE